MKSSCTFIRHLSFFIFHFLLLHLSAFSFEEAYVGAGAIAVMPQGGAKMRHRVGAAANAGAYVTDYLALEAEAGVLEGQTALAARGLWHLQGFEEFGLLFGYERFDPFLSLGARGFLGDGRGDAGPTFGLGAMYYLSDNWALRLDADATIGLDVSPKGIYCVSAGLRYSF